MNLKRPTPGYTVIKMAKFNNKRILKEEREKQLLTYKQVSLRLTADFSTEIFQVRRDWHEIFKVTIGKDLQPRLPRKAIIYKGRRESFLDKKKLMECNTTKPIL